MKVQIKPVNKRHDQSTLIEIHEHDLWNMDVQLGMIILPMLLMLKEDKFGIPGGFLQDVGAESYSIGQECFQFYEDSKDDAFKQAVKLWDETLDKMIWSFQQLCYVNYSETYHHGAHDVNWRDMFSREVDPDSGFIKLTERNPNSRWFDANGHEMHDARIQEGLDLFARYYRGMWT